MTDITRIISIATLAFLSMFCFQEGIFLWSGHKLRLNGRRTLIYIEFLTGILLLADALSYFYRGNGSGTGYWMVRLSNFCVFTCSFAISFFFCFYVCEFIKQSRLDFSLVLHPGASVKSGISVQLFIVLALCLAGICAVIVSQFTGLFYYFDENNVYHRSTFYPASIALGILPVLITLTMLLQNRKKLAMNIFVSLLLYFIFPAIGVVLILVSYGFPWINTAFGLGAMHLFFSSLKLMELEFYSGEHAHSIVSPVYKTDASSKEIRKRVVRSHFWQTLSVSLGGILVVLVIASITGISLPEKTLVIEEPFSENDPEKSVCVTFARNAEKHWVDGEDPDRTGAQYDGVIFNNMSSTIITDWNFSIPVPEGCSVDPGPWNGTFILSGGALNVKKPHEGDEENIHGEDFYTITPLKTLGFGCIMYTPHDYQPLSQKIVFSYSSVLKPLTNKLFNILLALLVAAFIISTTITLFEGKLIRVEEENQKLENTVQERTKELETEKNRSEDLLLNDVRTFNASSNIKLQIRLGINSGPLVAGVIGKTKFIYDIWGDTVNVASRMESTGIPMKIHVTEATKAQTSRLFQYSEHETDVKGKGMMKTYFL